MISFLPPRAYGEELEAASIMNNEYVTFSAWEGMPNVLLEAGASGLLVVATDVDGNREVVLDGENGFLAPPKDPERLRLMNLSAEERRLIGERARQHIEESYSSLNRVVDMWKSLDRDPS